ncbi:MAG: C13 family peptidase [Acidobacteriota bacterium]|nr:C13 family peptidase [Blastocatellia bacterium]MDW8241132.1 C13 family peptidase [Acidobacteriota bacterium]
MNNWLLIIGCWVLVIGCSAGSNQSLVAEMSQTPASTPSATHGQPPTATPVKHSQPPTTSIHDKFAIIISGVGGEASYAKRFAQWAETLAELLRRQLNFDDSRVFILSATPELVAHANVKQATAEAVRATLAQIKSLASAHSLIFVFLIGHGAVDNNQAKFNLVGPDMTAEDFDRALDALPTEQVIFVNTASASGAFINALSQSGRIVITATRSGQEQNATMFAEFFIQAFKEHQADFDKNQRVSLLEAFTFATQAVERWYKEQDRLATEHALLDDNGDKLGHRDARGGDGALARTTYLDSPVPTQAAADPELARLIADKERLEQSIETLKARKSQMDTATYESELERLLIELARISQAIKARQQ